MANFLVYNKMHWLDSASKSEPTKTGYKRHADNIDAAGYLSAIEKLDAHAKLKKKYDSKLVAGDIIEVRPDTQGMSGIEPDSLVLIKVKDLKLEEAGIYAEALYGLDSNNKQYMKIKRKYNVDISKLEFSKG